jgi:hypothetical protein
VHYKGNPQMHQDTNPNGCLPRSFPLTPKGKKQLEDHNEIG